MNRQKSLQKRVRAKFRCPQALSNLISASNYVSLEAVQSSLDAWSKFVADDFVNFLNGARHEIGINVRKMLDECVADVPEETKRKWIDPEVKSIKRLSPTLPDEEFEPLAILHILTGWHRNLRYDSHVLRRIALHFECLREAGEGDEVVNPPNTSGKKPTLVGMLLGLGPSGLDADMNGVDCDRIRICKICDRIFWANRSDSVTDSSACLNILRQRRFNENKRQQVNAQRAENYKNKKKGIVK